MPFVLQLQKWAASYWGRGDQGEKDGEEMVSVDSFGKDLFKVEGDDENLGEGFG